MKLTASKLRQNIYQILDHIIRTGDPVEIERNGHLIQINTIKKNHKKLDKLKKRKLTHENSENFTHVDWSHEWKGGK